MATYRVRLGGDLKGKVVGRSTSWPGAIRSLVRQAVKNAQIELTVWIDEPVEHIVASMSVYRPDEVNSENSKTTG